MDIESKRLSGALVLQVAGRVTAEDAPTLSERLNLAIRESDARLVLELTAVDFMGSAGLAALIGAVKAARAQNGQLVLVVPEGIVRTLLHVSGLLDYVTHTDALEAAVERLSA
jgi:anti-sigma B factor antagonist